MLRDTTTGHKTDHSNLRDIAGDMIGDCKVVSVAGLTLTAVPSIMVNLLMGGWH